jgi:hypothetical protein
MRSPLRLALLLALLAPTAAPAAELKLAAWNIRNLATQGRVFHDGCCERTPADLDRLRGIAEMLAADVVAVQEASSLAALARVFPPEAYVLCLGSRTGEASCRDDGTPGPDVPATETPAQNLAFAVRRASGLRVVLIRNLPALSVAPDGGWPEHPGLELVVEREGRRLALLNAHLAGCYDGPVASGSPNPACRTMAAQVEPLRAWMDEAPPAFAALGDFNRRFARETPTDALGPRLPAARLPLDEALCWPDDPDPNHRWSVDWILLGPGVAAAPGTSRRMFPALLGADLPPVEEGRRAVVGPLPVEAVVRF